LLRKLTFAIQFREIEFYFILNDFCQLNFEYPAYPAMLHVFSKRRGGILKWESDDNPQLRTMSQRVASKSRASIIIVAILLGSLGGYVLNWIYPLNKLVGESPFLNPTEEPRSGLLQTQTISSKSSAGRNGDDLVETLVPGMEMNLTVQANSTVELVFTASYLISMWAGFHYGTQFNVSIKMDGAAVVTTIIFAYRTWLVNVTEYEGGNIALHCFVDHLSAGNHAFEVVYFSIENKIYSHFYLSTGGYTYTRYFSVTEWAAT
jgi:hypothetical protein